VPIHNKSRRCGEAAENLPAINPFRFRLAAFGAAFSRGVSELVGPLGEPVGEIPRDLVRLVLIQPVLDDEPREEAAVDSPGHVVAGGNGKVGARIVVEANCIGEARRLRRNLAEAPHAIRTVEEPPGRPEPQRRIMARQRRQLAPVLRAL
jgi:hypothetical protein